MHPRIVLALTAFAAWALSAPAGAQPRPPAPPLAVLVATRPMPPAIRYPAIELEMRDLAAVAHVIPEARTDIAVALINPGPLSTPRVNVSQRRLVIDGGLRRRIEGCHTGPGGFFSVDVRRAGRIDSEHLPRLEIRVPQDAVVTAGGAVRLTMDHAQNERISLAGCGDADLAGATNNVDLAVAGGLDLRLFDAGTASVRVAGAGNVILGVVRSGLTISVAGAGDVVAAHADGPTNIAVQGSGDVTIRDGDAPTLSVMIAGSGDVRHGGSAARLDAAILGSGDVHVRSVSGVVSKRVFGSGSVIVGS